MEQAAPYVTAGARLVNVVIRPLRDADLLGSCVAEVVPAMAERVVLTADAWRLRDARRNAGAARLAGVPRARSGVTVSFRAIPADRRHRLRGVPAAEAVRSAAAHAS